MTTAESILEICKTAYNRSNGTPNDKTTETFYQIYELAKEAGFPVWWIVDHYKYCLLVNLMNIENYAWKVTRGIVR